MITRLGPHVITPTPPALPWSAVASVVKALDDPTPLTKARPDAIRVYRRYFANQDLNQDVNSIAAAIISGLRGYRHPNLHVETFNETQAPAADLVRFHRAIVPILHAAGVKVCGPCWSTGAFGQSDWQAFRDADWCDLDAVALHAYWGNQGFTQWNALRYRTYWLPKDPPLLITECGRDAVEGGKGGWRKDGVSDQKYLDELAGYDALIAQDAYVLGATVFTSGPTITWTGFDVDSLCARLAAMTSQNAQHATPGVDATVSPKTPPAQNPAPPVQAGGVSLGSQGGTGMRAGLFYRMDSDVPEQSTDALAALCASGGFTVVCPKAADGDELEGDFDTGALAIKTLDNLTQQRDAYAAKGVRLVPWVVPRGAAVTDEAVLHGKIGRICGEVIVDFEYAYPGFWDKTTDWADAKRYFQFLRQAAGDDVVIHFCPDPRQVARGDYPVADLLPFVSSVAPQLYWTDFQQQWQDILSVGVNLKVGSLPIYPVLPGDAHTADLVDAVRWLRDQVGSKQVYVFQRVGLVPGDFAHLKPELEAAPPAQVLNVAELAVFPDWAQGRLGNGQDFRGADGLVAFKAHLTGIGADPADVHRYGWPA